ncbi:MAG: hypothetical protein WA563_11300 [Candidatus Acidiferrales bacterium]
MGVFEPGYSDALLEVKCSYDFELVILTRGLRGTWGYLDSVYLGAIYDRLTVGLAKMISPREDDIIVHNDVTLRGTGIYQADFEILRVTNRKVRVVLDEVEKGFAYPLGEPDQWVEQQGKFEAVPATDKDSGITEIMTFKTERKKTVVERGFYWRKDFGIFEPTFWSPLQPAAKPAPKKQKGK